MRYLFIKTKSCCDQNECPANGLIEYLIATERPELIEAINPDMVGLGDTDHDDDPIYALPLDKHLTVAEARAINSDIDDWWQES